MDDTRLEWLGSVLESGLNINSDTYVKFLAEDRHEDRIDDFLNARLKSGNSDKIITNIFFYAISEKVSKSREVEYFEEEEIIEEVNEEEDKDKEGDENGEGQENSTDAAEKKDQTLEKDPDASENQEDGDTPPEEPAPKKYHQVRKVRTEDYIDIETSLFLSCGHSTEIMQLLSLTQSRNNARSARNTPIFYLSHFNSSNPTAIPQPSEATDCAREMPKYLEFGTMTANSLQILENLLGNVYEPLFSKPTSEIPTQFKDELISGLSKFVTHMRRTIVQLDNETRLEVPNNLSNINPSSQYSNSQIEELESVVNSWQIQIASSIDEQQRLTPSGNGPLAEIEFWCERKAALSALAEQLKLPSVENTLEVLQKYQSPTAANFKRSRDELVKLHIEANENVRFLSTLERDFKDLTTKFSEGFAKVSETIPKMMNSLRMVWIISRHYNKDERMVPLMERIAWALCDRVRKVINIKTIYKDSPENVKQLTRAAQDALVLWREAYYDMRKQIEANNRDPRWEFDKKKLFDKTDYIAKICKDLFNIAQNLEEFYNIFGAELKAVTGWGGGFYLFGHFFESKKDKAMIFPSLFSQRRTQKNRRSHHPRRSPHRTHLQLRLRSLRTPPRKTLARTSQTLRPRSPPTRRRSHPLHRRKLQNLTIS